MKFTWQKRLFVILLILIVSFLVQGKMENKTSLGNANLIRLHVIANSDSMEDQNLKRKVRDRIIAELGPEFNSVNDLDEARKYITGNLTRIEEIASEEIHLVGKNHAVETQLGVYPFPTKWYGNFVLPAGKYEALKVVIGEGKGANWWCVLFPPLCFVDISNSIAEEPQKIGEEKIQEVISQMEDGGVKNNPEIKVKFKLVEVLKSAKEKLKNIIASTEEP
ncbi:MAG: stage sporulation protein [Clostridia bacterium]|jgi:stage II sporulation protein R|nr:spoIIR [Clostridiales bacterium]MDK2986388.1 stage sporulation protein [Clostridia bacterium]